MVKEKVAKPKELEEIEENVKRRVEEAFVYAMESPFPKPEEAWKTCLHKERDAG